MRARKSTFYFAVTGSLLLFLALMMVNAVYRVSIDLPQLRQTAGMVRTLELTDLCLFTEASYTRHLSLADIHTPFQDYPIAGEHFPSGSLVPPPPHLTESHGSHD